MSAVTKTLIRRNTAMTGAKLVEQPCMGLLATEVALGTWLFGFDPEIPANEQKIFKADRDGDRDWTQHLEHPFMLVTWVAKKVSIPNLETGEGDDAIRIVLFDNEGDTIVFAAQGIAASLDLIRTLRGDGPYDPPIPVTFSEVKTRKGWKTKKMQPALVEPGKPKK